MTPVASLSVIALRSSGRETLQRDVVSARIHIGDVATLLDSAPCHPTSVQRPVGGGEL